MRQGTVGTMDKGRGLWTAGLRAGLLAFVLSPLSFVLPAFAAPEFSVTPYVQHPATNAMSILFFTTESCAATVRCWRADGKGETNEFATSCVDVSDRLGKNPTYSDSTTYAKQYKHNVRIKDLVTLTDYRYEVTLANGVTYRNMFRTLPGKDTPVRFVGYSDSETTPDTSPTTEWDTKKGGFNQYYVSRSVGFASNIVHMISRRPDLITISGDIAAMGGYQKNWDEFWKENAGANGRGYNDPAGSIPILAAIGNHDLKDGSSTIDAKLGGEFALEKYLTYFEYNPNGVEYRYKDGTTEKEDRDLGQLFHRTDLGPVTLIFLDTNKGSCGTDLATTTQPYADRPPMRSPDFHPGSPQYNWLTNNLADAQRNSRFTFVINHHCPYSVGKHNDSKSKTECAQAVRCLTDTMIRYGVDAWLCGHDEIQEHSQLSGTEMRPDGTTRAHTINVYDLGSGGDGLRGAKTVDNPYEVFRAYENEPDTWSGDTLVSGGVHYGFMEVDVTTNRLGKWTCSLTPCYDFINKVGGKAATFELRRYKDRIIIDEESDEIVYQERLGDAFPSDYVEYVRPSQAFGELPAPSVGKPTELSPATTEAGPVALLSDTQRSYLYVKTVDERRKAAAAAQAEGRESAGAKLFCFGSPVTLSWKGTMGACTVSVKRLSDGKVVATETTDDTSVTVCNLELGAQYEWTVTCGEESASATFCTDDTPPRLIRSGRMRMMRDLGGWTGTLEGKRYKIRQNLIFRGAAPDCPNPDEYLADDTARAFFRDVVGLRNEVDFRNLNDIGGDVSSGAKSTGMYKLDPKGEYGIAYNNFFFSAGSSLPTSGEFPRAVKFMTNPDNLPAYFHCKSGRDRTGMVAGFLLALLGVSEEDIRRDYQTTSDKDYYAQYGFKAFLDTTMPNYGKGLSLAESAKAYLIDCGLTDEQVENFRKKMLIGYGEPDRRIVEPVYVMATRTTVEAGKVTEEQYRGFQTEMGRRYAWGKDGKAATEWVESDGAPMGLEKPNEDEKWELLVR